MKFFFFFSLGSPAHINISLRNWVWNWWLFNYYYYHYWWSVPLRTTKVNIFTRIGAHVCVTVYMGYKQI